MIPAFPPTPRRRLPLSAFAMAIAMALALGAGIARAADTTPPAATTASPPLSPSTGLSAALSDADRAQAGQLAKTLEDPAARDKLIAQLKLLSQVAKPADKPSAVASPLRHLTQSLQDASDTILTAAEEIANIGNVVDWLTAQADDQKAQDRVLRVVVRLLVVFMGGLAIEWLLARLLVRPRRYVEMREATHRWLRLPLAAAIWVIDLVPVAGFAASAYALLALPFYRPGGHSELVSVAVITAYALSAAVYTLIDAIFRPRLAALRLLPLNDADAARLTQWGRRLARVGVWGYYTDDVLRLLGMPQGAFDSLLKLLGLALAIMVVTIVIEFRRPVSRWIRGTKVDSAAENGRQKEFDRRLAGLRGGLADVWHVLAMLYVLAAFVIWALRVEGGFEFLLRATLFTAVILAVARLLSSTLVRLVERGFKVGFAEKGHTASMVARGHRYARLARIAIQAAVAILAVLAVCEAWGADTLSWLGGDAGRRLTSAIGLIVGVIAAAVVVWELVNGGIERYLARTDMDGRPVTRSARARTLLPLVRNAFTIFLVLVVLLIVLGQVGVDVAPLIAGAGVIGVAIGFGSQKLVQDVITGAFMLFEDTIAVGDTVTIGTQSGVVEGMTIRTLSLRGGGGELYTLPFSSVTTVVNQSRGFAYFPFSIGISYRDDADRVMEVMRAVGKELQADKTWGFEIGAPIEVFGIDKFTDMAIIVSGQIRTMPGRQVPVGREFYRRLKKRFDELGIMLPHAANAIPEPPLTPPAPPGTPAPPAAAAPSVAAAPKSGDPPPQPSPSRGAGEKT